MQIVLEELKAVKSWFDCQLWQFAVIYKLHYVVIREHLVIRAGPDL